MSQDALNLDALISLVINDIYENITEHFVLVLDDYHLVEDQKDIRYFINRFIQDVSENVHLILASRVLLDLPDMTLMVARSQVGGLSYEELSFQPDEIQKLMQKNYDIALSDSEAAELANETEGWVTGLLLSTQVEGKTFANRLRVARVSGVGLYEYMARQILEQQPEDFQKFLLRSSLLEEFDKDLCEKVIGRALGIRQDWRKLIREVSQRILFVLPVGEDGAYLRYHHLFQEFLRSTMRREYPEEARAILLQLAAYYSQQQEWERSYAIYRELGETEALVSLVEGAGASMISKGQVLTLSEWLVKLPPELLYRNPTLVSLQGVVTVYRGDTGQGLKLLDQAVDGLRRVGDPAPLANTLYRRSTAHRIVGQYQNALNDAEEALQLLLPQNKSNLTYADALLSKGTVLYYLGELNESLELLKNSLDAYQSLGDENTAAKVYIEIGQVAKTLGKYVDAEEAYTRALNHYQTTGNLNWQANLYNNLGVLQQDRGDYSAATSSFEKAIQYARIAGSQRLEAYALASIGDLYQELDAFKEAREAYRQSSEISTRIHEEYLLNYLALMDIQLKMSQEDWPGAREAIEAALMRSQLKASETEYLLFQVEKARLELVDEHMEQALEDFSSALSYFERQRNESQIPRLRLYGMIAAALAGKREIAAAHAGLLKLQLGQPEKLKILVTTGREARAYLEDLREEPELFGLIQALLMQVEQHTQKIPAMRRLIRRHAVVVPFAPPKITIHALGRVQVKISDHVITGSEWQVQTARDLFFLLLGATEGAN
jgi:ATP/maltotriose-dependent transcriptional regulator MalT